MYDDTPRLPSVTDAVDRKRVCLRVAARRRHRITVHVGMLICS